MLAPVRKVLRFADLDNLELFELATSIKLIAAAFEKGYPNSSTVIQFQEYDHFVESEDDLLIGHFHVHLVPKDDSDPKSGDIYAILREDDKDFIINFKKKLKNPSVITEQNIHSIYEDGRKIKALVDQEIELAKRED